MSEPPPRKTTPGGAAPPDELTARNAVSPELLEKMQDESERVTVRRRIVIGPDGAPIILANDGDDDEADSG